MKKEIVLIVHNIRSTHNVGSILRTCDGFGVSKVYFTGYTPYPKSKNDDRLPHLAEKINNQIHKTALGAEDTVLWEKASVNGVIKSLKNDGYRVVALEQSPKSQKLLDYSTPDKVALILGEEVHGIEAQIIDLCDDIVEIPMLGQKESFNVSVACGIAIYQLRF